ncbi:glucose/quinate/shikimate family membrane-bound PQQ-dependent dehydrogenase [Azospirillum sp. SYSU D00513]|uniref:glucose/quinate/shikimate family membrane-bound PQQ-dependent dehydrogenase n=1 Tax=Azospirillum sp. SYSU D00513 TaxID=2812561 RepID=UPI001A9716EC|nr:glucose/quinate/shikimate family membrane-bound PQQ-dependent dehydrogenase [Azospirillum sp. SYSU D00513]
MVAVISGYIITALGIALGVGGVWLIVLGGSWYYALCAAGFLATGLLLAARRSLSLWVHAAVVLGTMVWALWEVGFDWWQLAPRGAVIVVIGLWLLLPWVTRPLTQAGPQGRPASWPASRKAAAAPLAVAILAAGAVALVAVMSDPHDREGRIPERTAALSDGYGGQPAGDWRAYGRSAFGDRYSPLDQINRENVHRLEPIWTYHTDDVRRPDDPLETTYEVTPLKIDDTLYLCTPHNHVIALNAETGEERWRFDPHVPDETNRQHLTCRGVSYHESASPAEGALCPRRIFMPTADARLIALDARTGRPCPGFGEEGTVDLWRNMPHHKEGFYYSTSPPAVADGLGLVIVGGAVNDNVSTNEPSGVIRAYDAETGALVWNWDSGNPDETAPIAPNRTYTENSPNSWSILSVDEALGMVYVPMGNHPPDQWGGNRSPQAERFSSSVVALDLATGQLRWVFQTVHHDLWDMDVPAQPSLLELVTPQGPRPAIVVPTKQGDIYVLDRRTGEPILPVGEQPAPQGAAAGDHAAPTQPVSSLTFRPPRPLEGRDMWGATLFDQLVCRIRFRSLRYEGMYTPPSEQGTLVHPGNFGVFNWGGVAVDPVRQMVFATPAYLPFVSRLIPRENATKNYVSNGEPGLNENYGAPFAVDLHPFVSPLGLPCTAPPWGYVAGADLMTGDVVWQHRNGTVRDQAPVPLPFKMGVPDLGGPVMTAGGVAFISGTLDYFVRGYDVATGEQLWESRLPAGGQATPMTYRAPSGRQILLVVAGGHGSLGTKAGDAVIAYALPEGG